MMLIEKTLRVKAPRDVVWAKLLNVEFMASCIPGVESVEPIDEQTFLAVIKAKVAFISATFNLTITITDKKEPSHLESSALGQGRLGVGALRQKQVIDLQAITENETQIIYKSEFNMSGKLAAVGNKIIRRKADELMEEFIKNFLSGCEEAVGKQEHKTEV